MRKILMATSALVLFGAGASFAQDQRGGNIVTDSLTPERNIVAQGNCVHLESGAGAFAPSDQNDNPVPNVVDRECPEGMMPRDTLATGAIDDTDPATGEFEPSNADDEPAPGIVE